MSPEVRIASGIIEDNAQHITALLLEIEATADKVAVGSLDRALQASADLARIRNDLGYSQDDLATTEDLDKLVNTRIESITPVISPHALEKALPLSKKSAETTRTSRFNIEKILTGEDDRLIVIVGPCSIDDPGTALEYAHWLVGMREKYGDTLEIVMRAYFEKPRTVVGWKGIINDPNLDNSCDTNLGVVKSRMLACQMTNMGAPLATERLNALTPQFFNGLMAYDAIGANNSSDQKAREYGSGSSSPVGFKNTKDGSVEVAVEAVITAMAPHVFVGMNDRGKISEVRTGTTKDGVKIGNEYDHIILRGGKTGSNYEADDIARVKASLEEKGLRKRIVVDASHGNSIDPVSGEKDHQRQKEVVFSIRNQLNLGEMAIVGVMIESNLKAGKQDFTAGETDVKSLERGVSITDGCIDIVETEQLLGILSGSVLTRRVIAAKSKATP